MHLPNVLTRVFVILRTLGHVSPQMFFLHLFYYEFGLEFHSYVEGYFVFSMHLAIVILNCPGESGYYRLLKDKLVEMSAVVTAKCQLSYRGMTGSDLL